MIEIPESAALTKQLSTEFLGKRVALVIAEHTKHGFAWYSHEPSSFSQLLADKTLTKVNAQGGQIELVFEDMHLVFGDGTTPHHLLPDDPDPQKHQLLIRFDDDSGFYCLIRMYGCVSLCPFGESDNEYFLGAKEKPSPLQSGFTREYFQSLVDDAETSLSMKGLLATKQRIPGLGNGVVQDILFNAGLHPQKKLKTVGADTIDRLYDSVVSTLTQMTVENGRDTEKDLYGAPGNYKTILSQKTVAEPCQKCGSRISKKPYLGGTVYFCSTCQPLNEQ